MSISFREDRGFLNADLALPAGDAPPEDTPIETAPMSHQAIIELPYALLADNQVRLGVLAARGDSLSTGMNLWVQQASGAYVNFGVTDNFALRGHVVSHGGVSGGLGERVHPRGGRDVSSEQPEHPLEHG